jgi:hypothetical protein
MCLERAALAELEREGEREALAELEREREREALDDPLS